jgi:general secretion pathway protein G
MNYVSLKEQKGKSKMNCILLKKQKGETKMKRAFTLIELMIVMAVIAILVGIALPRFKGMREEANITKAHGELRTLKIGIESYAMHHDDTYPATSATPYGTYLDAGGCPPGPQLIESVLYDPFNSASTEYYYILGSGTGGTDYYAICSAGPDGTPNVDAAEVGSGDLTALEILDDIVASNCTMLP